MKYYFLLYYNSYRLFKLNEVRPEPYEESSEQRALDGNQKLAWHKLYNESGQVYMTPYSRRTSIYYISVPRPTTIKFQEKSLRHLRVMLGRKLTHLTWKHEFNSGFQITAVGVDRNPALFISCEGQKSTQGRGRQSRLGNKVSFRFFIVGFKDIRI